MLQDAGVPAVHVAVMFPVYGEVFQMKPVVQLTWTIVPSIGSVGIVFEKYGADIELGQSSVNKQVMDDYS